MKSLHILIAFLVFVGMADCRAGDSMPLKTGTMQEGLVAVDPVEDLPSIQSTTLSTGQGIDKTPAKGPAEPVKKKDSSAPSLEKNATPPLDIPSLEKRLRETKAIGVFTKITLKNHVDDLVTQFREYHRGRGKSMLADLRQQYDMLLLKLLSLLQDSDPTLAHTIVASREAIWGILTDPAKFATI
jgi:hypothetical protein